MTTLQDLRKRTYPTIKAFAQTLGCSPSKAGMILQGRYIRTYHDTELAELASVLGVTFERCWLAMQESYNEWSGTPGKEHRRTDEVRAQVQAELREKMPDLGIEVEEPREMATIESVLVVPEGRRLR